MSGPEKSTGSWLTTARRCLSVWSATDAISMPSMRMAPARSSHRRKSAAAIELLPAPAPQYKEQA